MARAALRAVGEELLYARVDVAPIDGTPHLMELEVIEPSLYFRMHPAAPRNFADAVEAWLS